jgi:hypothetical protein
MKHCIVIAGNASINLTLEDVEISQDIEGWLVANQTE